MSELSPLFTGTALAFKSLFCALFSRLPHVATRCTHHKRDRVEFDNHRTNVGTEDHHEKAYQIRTGTAVVLQRR